MNSPRGESEPHNDLADPPVNAITTQPAPAGATPADVATTGLYCARCDYDLRSHALTDLCPECGTPVHLAIPPPGFRFGKAAAARRMLRGLSIMIMAQSAEALLYVYYWLVLWLSLSVPPRAFWWACRVYFYCRLAVAFVQVLGFYFVCWTFGRRRDRRLRALGAVVISLVALPIVPGCVGWLWPNTPPFGHLVNMRFPVWQCINFAAVLGVLLFCVLLLLRVCLRQNRLLCLVLLFTFATVTAKLALSVWSTVDYYQRWEYGGSGMWFSTNRDPGGLLAWYNEHSARVSFCIELIFILALWLYCRALRATIHRRQTPGVPPAPA